MKREEILNQAYTQRNSEIEEYQINIDNYALAIKKIEAEFTGGTPLGDAMLEFKTQLEQLLQSSIIEQRKVMIIRDVVQDQLGG